ncbi:MAG: MBL fold metallo-hydrolase [Chloroflexota bacterium]|nr:MBL fold metallo-hydrolase [Chloroflexota bacterium]
MKIKWLGHACFLITSKAGLRIITDPYTVGGGINYSPIEESADVVLVSHGHGDHSNVSAVRDQPEVVRRTGVNTAKGIQFKGVATYHDTSQGKQRGNNIIFCFTLDGIKVCHLGDLGHVLGPEQVGEIGGVDILFVPVGGFYTIDADAASQVCDQLGPRVIIPMHFRTSKCTLPIDGVDDFLKNKKKVKKINSSEVEFELGELPSVREILILKPFL